jgi:hypothetical protein
MNKHRNYRLINLINDESFNYMSNGTLGKVGPKKKILDQNG